MMLTVNDLSKKFPAASIYITQIYLVIRDYQYCNNRRLSDLIGVSPSAVTQAVSRLKRLDLAMQDRYGMVSLTDEGEQLAEEILKRHYLLEHLMVNVLKFPWDLADQEAEHLQDKVSSEFTDNLDERLGHPRVCPHGNPFPGYPRTKEILEAPRMTDIPAGKEICIVRITEEGERFPDLLHTCYRIGMMPGACYRIFDEDDIPCEAPGSEKAVPAFTENNNRRGGDIYLVDLSNGEDIRMDGDMACHIRVRIREKEQVTEQVTDKN